MATVTDRFHIVGSRHTRPDAPRTIYADGAGAKGRRPGVDIELSHWVPNSTPARYKADTSTGICLRYVADPATDDVDLVVNDHADVDGILSLYVLLHPDVALDNADRLVDAAAAGDFQAWCDRPAFDLVQQLTLHLSASGAGGVDVGDTYAQAFELTTRILERSGPEPSTAGAWAVLERGLELLDRTVRVEVVGERLASFVYPERTARRLAAVVDVPVLNQPVDDSIWLWPQVRNHDHAERVQLVSVPTDGGWWHDVWLPAHCWAETPGRWAVPGLVSTGDSNRWLVQHPPLAEAMAQLAGAETATGRWICADHVSPFGRTEGRRFPVVASFVGTDGTPVASDLPPATVAGVLSDVW